MSDLRTTHLALCDGATYLQGSVDVPTPLWIPPIFR